MVKKVLAFFVVVVILFSLTFVVAKPPYSITITPRVIEDFEDDDDLTCLPCGDNCFPADQVAAMFCQPPTNGEPRCGFENNVCVALGFGNENDFIEGWDVIVEMLIAMK
jgi:hypothetical protein